MYKCEECNLEFKTFQAKANHYRWKHLGYTYKNKETKEKAKINYLKAKELIHGKIIEEDILCDKCKKIIHIKYREGKKHKKYYCSSSCANGHVWSKESKLKQSNSIKKLIKEGKAPGYLSKYNNIILTEDAHKKYCLNCNIEIKGYRKFCSKECRQEYRIKNYTNYQKYHLACQFNFNLSDYPDEFDFLLVEKYGWYSAKNRGNNLNGVSRDHMFSIKEGFLQNIDPKIISHPANCKLMIHNDNVKKYKKCSITLEELNKKIVIWDLKYKNASVA